MSLAGLHQPLPLDDPAAHVAVLAPAREWLEHGRLRLLAPEEERLVLIGADEQHDPGACTDASDAHDLAGEVRVVVAHDEWMVGDDPRRPVDVRGQLLEGA
jgi:hypothetical protein